MKLWQEGYKSCIQILVWGLAIASSGVLVGCGEDVEAWKRDKLAQDLAKYQSAAGTYVGVVNSQSDGLLLGGLRIELVAQTAVGGEQAGKADQKPILISKVTYQSTEDLVLVSAESYYEPETQHFQATIPVTGTNGTEKVSLAGVIKEGIFAGQIEAQGYPEYGGKFSLTRNGKVSPELMKQIRETAGQWEESQLEVLGRLKGNTAFVRGESRAVDIVVMKPAQTAENDFLNLLFPVRTVHVTLNYSGSLKLFYQNARWDQRNRTISGNMRDSARPDAELSLKCTETEMADPGVRNASWRCDHVSNTEGLVASTTLKLLSGDLREEFPPAPPVSAPVSRLETYGGSLEIKGAVSRLATLQVLYPRKTESQAIGELFFPPSDEVVQVTLNIGSTIQFGFKDAKLDLNAGTLAGTYDYLRGTERLTLSMDCRLLTDANGTKQWECEYVSSSVGEVGIGKFVNGAGSHPGPTPNPIERSRSVKGKAKMPNGRTVEAILKVVQAAKSAQQEILDLIFPTIEEPVQATLTLDEVAIGFDPTRWNKDTQRLDAEVRYTVGNRPFVLQLACKGFIWVGPAPDLSCVYKSNQLTAEVPVTF